MSLGDELYDKLSTNDLDGHQYEIECDTFLSTFDSKRLQLIDEDDESFGRQRRDSLVSFDESTFLDMRRKSDRKPRRSSNSQMPPITRSTTMLSFLSDATSYDLEEVYDLAAQYDVDPQILEKCVNLTAEKFIAFRAVFDYIDADKSGSISADEFASVLDRIPDDKMKQKYSREEIASLIAAIDANGNQEVDFSEFLIMMSGSLSLMFEKKSIIKALQTFAETDDRNVVDVQRLSQILKRLHCSQPGNEGQENEIDELLAELPLTYDGYLNIKGFVDSVM